MGLRGFGAKSRKEAAGAQARARALPWKKNGLSRVERVMKFLEFMPVTKGILAGKRMKLLPGQREFVRAVYGRVARDGRRKIRIAIKSEVTGKPACSQAWHCATCSDPSAKRVAKSTAAHTTNCRPRLSSPK